MHSSYLTSLLAILAVIKLVTSQSHLETAQSHLYKYSRFSCDDLAPKQQLEIENLKMVEERDLKKIASASTSKKAGTAKLSKAESELLDLNPEGVMSHTRRKTSENNSNPNEPAQTEHDISASAPHQLNSLDIDGTEHVKKPKSAAQTQTNAGTHTLENSTTTTTTTTTHATPPAAMLPPAQKESGHSPLIILTSEDKYRRLKYMTGGNT